VLLPVILGQLTGGGPAAHPALSELIDPLLDQPAGRIVFAVVWTGIGLFLVTRGGGGDRRHPRLRPLPRGRRRAGVVGVADRP
jgi:hypothetical protein